MIAQDNSNKIKFNDVSLGFGFFTVSINANNKIGLATVANASFALNKNLVVISYLSGSAISLLDVKYKFKEPSLLYGREWKPEKWFAMQGFGGVGIYTVKISEESTGFNTVNENTISFPLRANAIFSLGNNFGLGLNTNYSINSLDNNFSSNLLFTYIFN